MSDDAFSWLTSDQIYTRKRKSGVSSLEILALPDDLRQLVNQVMRQEPVKLEALVAALERPEQDVRGQVALLTAQGWMQKEEIEGEIHYRVNLARRRARSLPPGIWQVLEGTWKIQLFRYFNDDEKADFTRAFKLESFESGECIFRQGEWGHSMYLLDSGVIELVTQDAEGNEVVLSRLRPGAIIGEVAVLLGERRWATARAVEPVSVWTLYKNDLDSLLSRSPSAGLALQREIERQVHTPERRIPTTQAGSCQTRKDDHQGERYNPILIVGQEAAALAQSLAEYTGERLLLLNLHAPPQSTPSPLASSRLVIEHRSARHLDSKALTKSLQEGLAQFDRVIVAAPNELHSPLMSVISLIDLVIDLSGTEVPWVIAAARRRWTIPTERPPDIARIARRLCQRVLGVALSGGAARTLAHIGALRALEEAQMPIDMIASTGIGAVIAGLYAAGFSVDELTDLAIRHDKDLNPFDGSLNLRLVSRSALYAGKHARQTLQKLLQDRTFDDLSLPLYIVAADLESGQPIVFKEGPLIDALEASLALAGLVAPAERDQRSLVDGGLINPMPANVLVEHGAGLVIGINTIPRPNRKGILPARGKIDLTSTWLRLRDQLAYAALMSSLRHLDLLIMLQVDQFDGTDFDRAAELIASGLAATQREIHHIRTLLAPDTRL